MRPASVWALVLLCGGCDSETNEASSTAKPAPVKKGGAVSSAPASAKRPPARTFLDEKKTVPPHLEWTRDVISRNGGVISFRVESQGPFAITVATGRAVKMIQSGDKKPIDRSDVLLIADSNGPSHEGKVTLPVGSSFFIIENRSDKPVEFHLQCSPSN